MTTVNNKTCGCFVCSGECAEECRVYRQTDEASRSRSVVVTRSCGNKAAADGVNAILLAERDELLARLESAYLNCKNTAMSYEEYGVDGREPSIGFRKIMRLLSQRHDADAERAKVTEPTPGNTKKETVLVRCMASNKIDHRPNKNPRRKVVLSTNYGLTWDFYADIHLVRDHLNHQYMAAYGSEEYMRGALVRLDRGPGLCVGLVQVITPSGDRVSVDDGLIVDPPT